MQYVHRYKMERVLRRKLEKHEVVHHIDGNGLNNNIRNLQVMTVSEHDKLHNGMGAKALESNEPFQIMKKVKKEKEKEHNFGVGGSASFCIDCGRSSTGLQIGCTDIVGDELKKRTNSLLAYGRV